MSKESAHLTIDFKDHYVIFPSPQAFDLKTDFLFNNKKEKGKIVKSDFEYSSGKNEKFLTINEIQNLNKKLNDPFSRQFIDKSDVKSVAHSLKSNF